MDQEAAVLPEDLPEGARLQVALFAFDGEIGIASGADVGEIRIQPGGSVGVERLVVEPDNLKNVKLLDRRLFFPVTTPDRAGTFRLRCNIYYKRVLIQSHLIHAEVAPLMERLKRRAIGLAQALRRGRMREPALQTTLDYTLSNTLRLERLAPLKAHSLSLMLNDNGDGTHGFRFLGTDGEELFKDDASFDSQDLKGFIDKARGAMRKAAWGDESPWEGKGYRYKDGPNLDWLREDLSYLAKKGKRIHTEIIERLAAARSEDAIELHGEKHRLKSITLKPGRIQIASKRQLRLVMPIAVLYDYPLDDMVSKYTLCEEFHKALDEGHHLAETRCFQGYCPTRNDNTVVCPSGFWGYRHSLGMPFSIGREQDDAAMIIGYKRVP